MALSQEEFQKRLTQTKLKTSARKGNLNTSSGLYQLAVKSIKQGTR